MVHGGNVGRLLHDGNAAVAPDRQRRAADSTIVDISGNSGGQLVLHHVIPMSLVLGRSDGVESRLDIKLQPLRMDYSDNTFHGIHHAGSDHLVNVGDIFLEHVGNEHRDQVVGHRRRRRRMGIMSQIVAQHDRVQDQQRPMNVVVVLDGVRGIIVVGTFPASSIGRRRRAAADRCNRTHDLVQGLAARGADEADDVGGVVLAVVVVIVVLVVVDGASEEPGGVVLAVLQVVLGGGLVGRLPALLQLEAGADVRRVHVPVLDVLHIDVGVVAVPVLAVASGAVAGGWRHVLNAGGWRMMSLPLTDCCPSFGGVLSLGCWRPRGE
mmetsp:Transcript_12722/g.36998  ORF Transcript_12722/g.36998 Transcript_12722/m.36998 type:complete len:323 (-) Transcript_12722:245-1213(-)